MQNNTDKPKGNQKILTGVVVSDKMDKTIKVVVTRLTQDQRYLKTVRKHSSFMAHDEKNEAKAGDKVRIVETRPLSKLKRWRLLEVLKK